METALLDTNEEKDYFSDSLNPKDLKSFMESEEFFKKVNTPVDKCIGELFFMILCFCIRHCLSFTAIVDLFQLINAIFSSPIVPASRYFLNKLFNSNENIEFHSHRNTCGFYIGNFMEIDRSMKNCSACESPLDLILQIQVIWF